MKKILYPIFLILLVYIITEGACLTGLILLRKIKDIEYSPKNHFALKDYQKKLLIDLIEENAPYIKFDAVLGWSIQPHGEKNLYKANSLGFRANKDYPLQPNAGTIRIATFGDSFTHGDEVNNDETWQHYLEQKSNQLEVLNFGVPGYGLDQALLLFKRRGVDFHANYIIVGLMVENTYRHLNRFRPFYSPQTKLPLTKPRFVLNDQNKIQLIPNPVSNVDQYHFIINHHRASLKNIGLDDAFYNNRYYAHTLDFLPSVRLFKIISHKYENKKNLKLDLEGIRLTEKIISEFRRVAQKNKAELLVLLLPYKQDLIEPEGQKNKRYLFYKDYLKSNNIPYLDLNEELLNDENFKISEDLFTPRNHNSAKLNQYIGNKTYQYLHRTFQLPAPVKQ